MWVCVCLHTWAEIPNISVLFECALSATAHLPVTVFPNLEKKEERKRYFNPFAHNSSDFSGNSSSSERGVPFSKAALTQQVFEFSITRCLNLLPCQIRTKNTSLSSQGPYGRCFPRHLESQMWSAKERQNNLVKWRQGRNEVHCQNVFVDHEVLCNTAYRELIFRRDFLVESVSFHHYGKYTTLFFVPRIVQVSP